MTSQDPLLDRLRKFCLALPETSEADSWGHPNFKAGKKVFVTYEWLKGGVPTIAFRLDPADVSRYAKQPGFVTTPFGRGQWVSLEADRRPKWSLVQELALKSYRIVALQRMLRALETRSRQR
jgi:predicted DNA-binding protein (MmcQ/YjbR family)